MKKYTNYIEINGQSFTNIIEADSIKEAYQINNDRKRTAALKGRRIYGHLTLA